MKTIVTLVMLAAITAMSTGCSTERRGTGSAQPKKVADHVLSTYTPLRRILYRDACARQGDVTVCVERIIISDSAAVIEARINNEARLPYVLGYASTATAQLANEAHETLVCDTMSSKKNLEPGETAIQFRMSGRFQGEPATLTVNVSAMPVMGKPQYRGDKRVSVVVRLNR